MKKFLALTLVFSLLIFLMGMGGLGGTAPADKIPAPEKNFTVQVVDSQGTQTSLAQFSYEGKVYLPGKHGRATITIPFEKISQFQVQEQEADEVLAKVFLRDQKNIEIKVDKRTKFYGQAEFGTFQIEIRYLKSVSFRP